MPRNFHCNLAMPSHVYCWEVWEALTPDPTPAKLLPLPAEILLILKAPPMLLLQEAFSFHPASPNHTEGPYYKAPQFRDPGAVHFDIPNAVPDEVNPLRGVQ